ncbi:MAG: hypothetical protein R3C56_35245 [Pirellulaceae bacterium]
MISSLTIAIASTRPTAIDKATIAPDRYWQSRGICGKSFHIMPTVVTALKKFWVKTSPHGTAVLF